MQKSPLLEFIKDKINALPPKTEKEPPVITISREYGCPGVLVANEVTKKLSSKYNSQWSILDKQVILQAAEEFNISEEMIQEILQNKPKGVFEELFLSFSDINLPSDVQIRKTIARIIRTVALHGNVVVLGRGGVVITRDIKKSVHVHLHAPLDYRV
ncbi:MAG: cytidylate kinase family protein, partial [Leptospiraceae bacterium]|nr:cytidylate kinase family protein [Leptospiraceae bacterium]